MSITFSRKERPPLGPFPELIPVDEELELKVADRHDAERLFAYVEENRSHLRPWLPWVDDMATAQQEEEFLRLVEQETVAGQSCIYVILSTGQKSVLGTLGTNWVDAANRTCGIGYALAAKSQGRGVMTKCAAALISNLFEKSGFHRIVIEAAVENRRSCNVAQRLGFRQEGVCKERQWLHNRYIDTVLYAMTVTEWNAQNKE